ncbi:hypothetical protein [Clostridium acidisoli]|nr:hypothetical protein [Clostridium acidisoli]
MATFNVFDVEHVMKLNKKYENYSHLIRLRIGEHIYLKKARDMELPCFCFYILKQSMLPCQNKEGKCELTTTIPSAYFRDFMDNLDAHDVEK